MNRYRFLLGCAVWGAATSALPAGWMPVARAQAPAMRPPQSLLEVNDATDKLLQPTVPQVAVSRSQDAAAPGYVVTVQPGTANYPGINIKPSTGSWDASQFGHIEAHVTNVGTKVSTVVLRVDNAGKWQDNPWNTESIRLQPGQSGVITVIFGYAYGHQPNFALNPAAIVNMNMFAQKADYEQAFRIDSLAAAGQQGEKPEVKPDLVRIPSTKGFLLGGGASVDVTKQFTARGAQPLFGTDQTLKITFPGKVKDPSLLFKPPVGRWTLADALQVRLKVHNDGNDSLTPRVRLETNGGPSPWVSTTIAAGADGELVIPFLPAVPHNPDDKSTENHIASNAVQGIAIATDQADVDRVLLVKSIVADVPEFQMPDWVGKRPPVAGDWEQTLNEEFNGNTIDSSLWSVTGANYYDKRTHWTKDDVISVDGQLTLRYEKKTGNQNDDPKETSTPYAAGYLASYDKWAQRYGYFEARMKFPAAPGLWPAFWLMPDRGREAGIWWKRNDTKNGGMEFDIAEHLTGWGPYRYNIAMHWDGYQKEHKSTGSDKIYVQPDKDGYITAGLLWLPGSVTYYCNGRELLRWENERVANVPSSFLFSLPSGGWDNLPLDDAKLPADWKIDYVRVWQRKDLVNPGDGKKPPLPPDAKPEGGQ